MSRVVIDELIFANVCIAADACANGDLNFAATADGLTVQFAMSPKEVSRLAAALNDFSARSAPVCDEAEG